MPNEGFMHQLQIFEQCEYAPTETHPVYIAWKKAHDEAVANCQAKYINIIPVVDDRIYLSRYITSEFPSRSVIQTRRLTLLP